MDSVSAAFLWFFASLFGAALFGWLIGNFTSFFTGLAVGLLIPGALSANYAVQFFIDHHTFAALAPNMATSARFRYRQDCSSSTARYPRRLRSAT